MSNQEFIKKIGKIARKDMLESGILASVTIAQAILESGYGKSELAQKANNFFGMKCNLSGNTWASVWDGKSKYAKKTQEDNGKGKHYYVTANFRKYPNIKTSVKDHSLYLLGAKNGSKLRYKGLKGERNYKTAIRIIKKGGYATDTKYVDKVCDIIKKYNLTQYDALPSKGVNTMKIIEKLSVKNDCYKQGKTITVKGLMLHSVACPQPSAEVFANSWNKSGITVAVHGVLQADGTVYQCLPWNMRGWHAGGSANNTHIGVEMTEPACIKYRSGSTFTCSDKATAIAQVKGTYKTAVELFAYLCKKYRLNPTTAIISHKEGHAKGVASNHGDPDHLWKGLGLSYTMDTFRADVKKAMSGGNVDPDPTPDTDNTPFVVRVTIENLNIRKGPGTSYDKVGYCPTGSYTIVETKVADGYTWGRLKSGAGWIALEYTERV